MSPTNNTFPVTDATFTFRVRIGTRSTLITCRVMGLVTGSPIGAHILALAESIFRTTEDGAFLQCIKGPAAPSNYGADDMPPIDRTFFNLNGLMNFLLFHPGISSSARANLIRYYSRYAPRLAKMYGYPDLATVKLLEGSLRGLNPAPDIADPDPDTYRDVPLEEKYKG